MRRMTKGMFKALAYLMMMEAVNVAAHFFLRPMIDSPILVDVSSIALSMIFVFLTVRRVSIEYRGTTSACLLAGALFWTYSGLLLTPAFSFLRRALAQEGPIDGTLQDQFVAYIVILPVALAIALVASIIEKRRIR